MKIYTVEIAIVGETSTQAVFERPSIDAAYAAYHQFMASCMANNNCSRALCIVIDDNGGVYRKDTWSRTVGPN